MAVNARGNFEYPTNGWSTGTMRKAKGRQMAMDVRRGQPELEEPGIAEAEKIAGASKMLSDRGGSARIEGLMGTSPADLIAQHKEQLTAAVDQHAQGSISTAALKKKFDQLGWQVDLSGTSVQATDPNGELHQFPMEAKAQ